MVGTPELLSSLAQSLTSAAAGLLGVAIGGFIESKNPRAERSRSRVVEQLRTFYGPLLSIRTEILAKSEIRVKMHAATARDCEWSMTISPEKSQNVTNQSYDPFKSQLEYSNAQLENDWLSLYRKMLELYRSNLWLAEVSTLRFHKDLLNL